MNGIIKLISSVWNDKNRIVITAFLGLLFAWDFTGHDTQAVTEPVQHKKAAVPKNMNGRRLPAGISVSKRSIPVFWQSTRSRFLSSGASTQTESYRETWQIEPRDEKTAYL